MKCPDCKSPSFVLETRHLKDGAVRRRYECFNTHRFSTLETVAVLQVGRPRMKIQKIEPAREGGG